MALRSAISSRFLVVVAVMSLLFLLRTASARPAARSRKAAAASSTRNIQLGTDMHVTTHLVKSPRSMWVIGKLVYLTNRTAVEVKPKEILVMTRPYGPPKILKWIPKPPPIPLLLYHDEAQELSVVLKETNSLTIYYENSKFDIFNKEEKLDSVSGGSGGGSGGGGSGPSNGVSEDAKTYKFLSVQLSQTTAALRDADIGVLTATTTVAAPNNASLANSPTAKPGGGGVQQKGRSYTYFHELLAFFRNIKEMISYGAEIIRNSKLSHYFSGFIELYRPRYSDGTAI